MSLFHRRALTLVLIALFACPMTGCKKSAEDADAVTADASGAAGEEGKTKKSTSKKKSNKSKAKSKAAKKKAQASTESSDVKEQPKTAEAVASPTEEPPAPAKTAGAETVAPAGEPAQAKEEAPSAKGLQNHQPPPAQGAAVPGTPPSPKFASATPPGSAAPKSSIPVALYLNQNDLNGSLTIRGWMPFGPVQGIPPSDTYNSIMYKAAGTDKFVTLQVWKYDNSPAALEKWNELMGQMPKVEKVTADFTKEAFLSSRPPILVYVWMDAASNSVYALGCKDDVCNNKQLGDFGRLINDRTRNGRSGAR